MAHTPMHTARTRRRHAALLAGCALGLVLAALPQAALAQDVNKGFQGIGTVDAGGAAIFTSDGGKTTAVNIGTPTAVITWKPDDQTASGTIDFLPSGHSALFGSTSQSDYTVLNRILPNGTANIGLNGTITSSVANGRMQAPGGNVWFYTPNGFVIGPTAMIQVGGLVMTTNDITYSIDPASALPNFTDANGAINFRGPDGSKGSIVNNGSIVGNNANSYIALVAPRIEQHGFVSADRSIAYVAAEQVDLKINAGNFDIVIGEGTTDENGVFHDGTTTGAASTGSGDQKTMRFVAVPKNTALTMLLSGGIGYTPAASAFSDGSAIVLSADGGADGAPDGNIKIGAADFTNRLNAHATGDLTVAPTPPGPFDEGTSTTLFRAFTDLRGDKSVHITAGGGTRIEALNSLTLTSDSAAGGGSITLEAFPGGGFTPAGEIAVSAYLQADASHYGDVSDDGNDGLDSQGGTITIAADGGQISAGSMYLYAGGYGGFGSKTGGDGFGGQIDLRAGYGGDLTTSFLYAVAEGHGGGSYEFTETGATGGLGGVGNGGAITLADSSGSVADDPTGGHLGLDSVYLDASAIGGNSLNSSSGLGGDAFGGTIGIALDRQNQSFAVLDAHARAEDGDGGAQDPVGGDITMAIGGGIALALDSLHLDTGVYASINSPAGAFGRGGTIDVTVADGASVTVANDAEFDSLAEISPFFFESATSSPDLTGGRVSLLADNGTFEANNILIDVSANNVGAGVSAGFAQGGDATVRAANGGTIAAVANPFSEGESGVLRVEAEGYGTGGTSANLAAGGTITLASETGATIVAGSGTIELNARGEFGIAAEGQAMGVTARGGGITIDALGGTIATGILADAGAQGGDADTAAGSGVGGTIDVQVLGGTLVNPLLAYANGTGGAATLAGDGGDGTGGRFTLTSDKDATFTDFGLAFYGDGQGGYASEGTGGDGTGGSARVDVIGGTHTWSGAYLSGQGFGAASFCACTVAGSGYGSPDGLDFHIGGGADLALGYLDLAARAWVGGDGNANSAQGGLAHLLVDSLANLTADGISLSTNGGLASEDRDPASYATTPSGSGGIASAVADNGTITTSYLSVVANGTTGGALTSAGIARGGVAEIGSSAGGLIGIIGGVEGSGGLTLEARGLGAEGPSAANAFGGTARLYTEGGAISSVFGIVVNANAEAGDFANYFAPLGPANGYDARAGTATVEMRAGGVGGSITAPSLTVTADSRANQTAPVEGTGGTGDGNGSFALVTVDQGILDTGPIVVTASGFGGQAGESPDGGTAFVSGDGLGGIVSVSLSGGAIDATSVTVLANGTGAAGYGATSGSVGSLAGAGEGGIASFDATGGTLNDSGALVVQTQGSGGIGAYNPGAGAGGDGASGTGGISTIRASGTALLTVDGAISIGADGIGGLAGSSFDGTRGAGGNGRGGIAAMNLADIAFDFGRIDLSAAGGGGFGATLGTGRGGIAAFSLVDGEASGGVIPRIIDTLFLGAAGFDASEQPSIGGRASFEATVSGPDAALGITNDLTLYGDGVTSSPGLGATINVSGAPVTVGGAVEVVTPGRAVFTLADGGALDITGKLDVLVGRTLTSSGPISTAADARVIANNGIMMTDLVVGGTTLLQAVNGPLVISNNLGSEGPVTALGQSVSIVSLGGLSFADADATSGDLAIATAGDLLLATADASGAVALTSTGGSIHNTGSVNGVGISYTAAGNVQSDAVLASGGALSVDAGGTFSAPGTVSALGDVALSADQGMTLSAVASGGTTRLAAANGPISIASLTSPGAVTAEARRVTIGSPGALRFARAQATAGNLSLTTAGNLVLDQGGAFGALNLTSTGGSVRGAGPIVSGGNTAVSGAGGIALGTLSSGGTTSLLSANGAVSVSDLNSAGAVTARGRAVTIGSSGSLSFADLDATAGNIAVEATGDLAAGTGDATGSISLVSTGGAITATGALNASAVSLRSLANLDASGAITTSGAATLESTDGAVFVDGAIDAGTISARALDDVLVTRSLAASGSIELSSTAGMVGSTGTIAAGGPLDVSGNGGISFSGSASSGAATTLAAAEGTVSLADLASAGPVSAIGDAVTISSGGSLTFSVARAAVGDLVLRTAGSLVVEQADAAAAIDLTSTGGSVSSTGTGAVVAGGDVRVSARESIAFGPMTSGGQTSLTAGGSLFVGDLLSAGTVTARGGTVTIGSTGALSFADAQANGGSLSLTTAGDLALQQASATGAIFLTSTGGAVGASGAVSAGAEVVADGFAGLAFDALTSGAHTVLTSSDGAVDVADLNSALGVTASGRSIVIRSSGALAFDALAATAGNLAVRTAGDLSVLDVSAPGSVTLTSAGGALDTGSIAANGITLGAFDTLDITGDLTSGGGISLASTGGSVESTGGMTAAGNLVASARNDVILEGPAVAGGTTELTGSNGAVVANDLRSAGQVTTIGRSISIGSTGGLNFAAAQATAGDLTLSVAGDLAIAQGSASGAVNLASSAGSITGSGPIVAGADARISGAGGVSLAMLTSGGTTLLSAADGAVRVADLRSAGAVTARGTEVAIGSSGALSFADLDASAGDVEVQTAGDLSVGTVDAPGSITLTSTDGSLQTGGAINGSAIALRSFADLELAGGLGSAGELSLTSTGGAVTGGAPIVAGGDVAIAGESGIALGAVASGGTTSLLSENGAVAVTGLESAGSVFARGSSITIASGGALDFAGLEATAGDVAVQTAGDLALNTVDATGSVMLTSAGGALQVGGVIHGNGIALSSLASLAINGLVTPGAISLTSTGGSVSATGAVSAGGSLSASGRTGIALGDLSSGGTTTLTAADGAIEVAALTSAGGITAAGRAIDLRGPGSLDVSSAHASAGDLILQAGEGLTVADVSASGAAALSAGATLATNGLVTGASIALDAANVSVDGELRSTAGLDVFASHVFALGGLAAGTEIAVTSGDIAIGATGRLGSRGLTDTITLRNLDSGSPMSIGGTGQEGQYSLDNAEAARLFADQQISFVALAGEGGGGDVDIGDLALAFGDQANIGTGGLLKVDAGGVVEVSGAVALTTVSGDDGFSIDPTRIDVIAGDGSIVMRNAAGDLQGTLELQADTIAVADRTTLEAIGGLTDFAAISAALDTPTAAGPEGGNLQAGTINFIVGDSLFIQNSGATTEFDDRRGFLANALSIESESSAPQIAINGVIASPAGDLIGLDTSGAVSINGVLAVDLPSSATVTINGCNAGIDCGRPAFSYNGLSSDDLELGLTASEDGKSGPTGQLVQVEDNKPLITPPLVDEPITGVGNDDLWQVKCSAEDDKGVCPAGEGTE